MALIRTENQPSRQAQYSTELELLQKSGIIKDSEGIEGQFIQEMDSLGLGRTDILSKLALLMDSAETDSVKLSAIKLAIQLHMHPALVPRKDSERKETPQITFIFGDPKRPLAPASVIVDGTPSEELWKHNELAGNSQIDFNSILRPKGN